MVGEFLIGLRPIERVTGAPFSFSDCAMMTIVYAGAFLLFARDMKQATLFIDRLFNLRGVVLPTSIEDKKLVALRDRERFEPLRTEEKRCFATAALGVHGLKRA